jgi:hypothetical protein
MWQSVLWSRKVVRNNRTIVHCDSLTSAAFIYVGHYSVGGSLDGVQPIRLHFGTLPNLSHGAQSFRMHTDCGVKVFLKIQHVSVLQTIVAGTLLAGKLCWNRWSDGQISNFIISLRVTVMCKAEEEYVLKFYDMPQHCTSQLQHRPSAQ